VRRRLLVDFNLKKLFLSTAKTVCIVILSSAMLLVKNSSKIFIIKSLKMINFSSLNSFEDIRLLIRFKTEKNSYFFFPEPRSSKSLSNLISSLFNSWSISTKKVKNLFTFFDVSD
jgi:hypothetical protein